MKIQGSNLKDNFLISMPSLGESQYKNTIIYLCHQGEYGSMGIVLNHEYDMDLKTMFSHLNIPCDDHTPNQKIYHGGPVQNDRGFILHPYQAEDSWLSSYQVSDELSLTSSLDILELISTGRGPSSVFMALGYIGWGPGELEQEIIDNLWLSCPANLDIIFNVPAAEKMQAAASQLGVDLELLSNHSGNA